MAINATRAVHDNELYQKPLEPLELNQKLLGGSVHTLMGVTKREPLMLESVTWLSSTAVMISSAPVMIAMSRLG